MHTDLVALHPEGVDRNTGPLDFDTRFLKSPSTRRAWIEIQGSAIVGEAGPVALHPEGVDRNLIDTNANMTCFGRPPPGGRG